MGENLYKNLQFNKNMLAARKEDERRFKHVSMGDRPAGDGGSVDSDDIRFILKGVTNDVYMDARHGNIGDGKFRALHMGKSDTYQQVVQRPMVRYHGGQPPFTQEEYVSCGSEAGSAMSQDTITSSVLDLRERVREKKVRAMRRLRGMLKIIEVWKQHRVNPVIAKF